MSAQPADRAAPRSTHSTTLAVFIARAAGTPAGRTVPRPDRPLHVRRWSRRGRPVSPEFSDRARFTYRA
ncbi:hypothetical protein ABIA39_008136 [Nocardia sp. GAS34]|uniref:hypothetical protein n=1 Tax=unclassified Nocardia TaxID=2637762 RepID=UPI003D1B47F4